MLLPSILNQCNLDSRAGLWYTYQVEEIQHALPLHQHHPPQRVQTVCIHTLIFT